MPDMKKIKTKLVTFVTDKVLLVTYFGNKDFLRVESTIAAMGHDAAPGGDAVARPARLAARSSAASSRP
jgi:hypothetical protein